MPRAERRGLGMEKERERRREDERGGKEAPGGEGAWREGREGESDERSAGEESVRERTPWEARETMGLPKDPTGRRRSTSDTASKILRDEPTFA